MSAERKTAADHQKFLICLQNSLANPQFSDKDEGSVIEPNGKIIRLGETGSFDADENGKVKNLTEISPDLTLRAESSYHAGDGSIGYAIDTVSALHDETGK